MAGCSDFWWERLSAWHDGEATAEESAGLEFHLVSCEFCALAAVRFGAITRQLRALGEARDTKDAAARARISQAFSPSRRWKTRAKMAGALAVALAMMIGWLSWPFGINQALAADLERNHLKSFSRARPCDFESSEAQVVQRWVASAVGYPVQVPEVPGATLLGARRCRVKGVLTAALLYRKDGQALTLFVPGPQSPTAEDARSFSGGAARCAKGPHGETICIGAEGAGSPVLAVADLEEPALLELLASATR